MSLQMQMLVSAPTETSIHSQDIASHVKNHSNSIIAQKIKKSTTNFKTFEINIFSQAKDMLNISEVVGFYGVHLNKSGFGLCPFHSERTASFKVYTDSFYCFGCNESGTVIDFVMKLMGLSAADVVRQLNNDFRLNIMFDGDHQSCVDTAQIMQTRNYVAEFEAWERRAFSILSRCHREIHERSKIILTPDYPDVFLQEHIAGLAEMPYIEWLLDMMIENMRDFKRQVEFYRDYGEVVARYDR